LGANGEEGKMGKASFRRKRDRQRYLARLANENPSKFHSEWCKRLDSWEKDAFWRASHMSTPDGNPVEPTFNLIEYALEELAECGNEARKIAEADTREALTDACTRAVAMAVNPKMVRFRIMRDY